MRIALHNDCIVWCVRVSGWCVCVSGWCVCVSGWCVRVSGWGVWCVCVCDAYVFAWVVEVEVEVREIQGTFTRVLLFYFLQSQYIHIRSLKATKQPNKASKQNDKYIHVNLFVKKSLLVPLCLLSTSSISFSIPCYKKINTNDKYTPKRCLFVTLSSLPLTHTHSLTLSLSLTHTRSLYLPPSHPHTHRSICIFMFSERQRERCVAMSMKKRFL